LKKVTTSRRFNLTYSMKYIVEKGHSETKVIEKFLPRHPLQFYKHGTPVQLKWSELYADCVPVWRTASAKNRFGAGEKL
jgi:hypothetical protein